MPSFRSCSTAGSGSRCAINRTFICIVGVERTTFPLDLLIAQTRATTAYQPLAVPRPVHTAALHRALLRWETAVHYHPYWTPQGHCAGGRAEQRLAARAELARHERQETAA